MSYIDKIRNHERFQLKDIEEFVQEQASLLNLQQYLVKVEAKNLFRGKAAYSYQDRTIYIISDLNKEFEHFKKVCFESKLIHMAFCNGNDLYNLYVIYTIFHEIWHAKQQQQISENKNSSYSQLVDLSLKLIKKSESTYYKYHDRYFHESDAIVNSIIMTLDFIKSFDFQENALIALNKSFAKDILNSYVKTDYIDNEDKYSSPVLSMEFLVQYLRVGDWIPNPSMIIDLYKREYITDDDLKNLMNGNQISEKILNRLKDIKSNRIKTVDIFGTLNLEKIENKHI